MMSTLEGGLHHFGAVLPGVVSGVQSTSEPFERLGSVAGLHAPSQLRNAITSLHAADSGPRPAAPITEGAGSTASFAIPGPWVHGTHSICRRTNTVLPNLATGLFGCSGDAAAHYVLTPRVLLQL